MLGKNRTWILLAILVVVVVIYFVLDQISNRESNFETRLPGFDTAAITSIEIIPAAPNASFILVKEKNNWEVAVGDKKYDADNNSIRSLMGSLNGSDVKNVVATSSENWATYDVTEEKGTRIRYLKEDRPLSDLVLGRFEYIQPESQMPDQFGRRPQGEMLSFVRIYDESPVYVIDGMIALGLGKQADAYRNKQLLQLSPDSINRVDITYSAGNSLALIKSGKDWIAGDMTADSAIAVKYFQNLSNLRGKNFSDAEPVEGDLFAELTVRTNDPEPIVIRAYTRDTSNYLLTTSQNPTNTFLQDRAFLDKVIVTQDYFLAKD